MASEPQASQDGASAPRPSHILPAEHWAQQALDDKVESSIGDQDTSSSTASLSASIVEYRTLHGRTFHSDRHTAAEYWTPNDERALEASHIIHHCITLIHDGNLFRAPLGSDIQNVIDIGTGSGIWAIDFADQFPNANVIGTDISPTQPNWVPPNLSFEIEDATVEWAFPDNHFDYVHLRYLFGSIADWSQFLSQAYRVCKPGGYVESYEASCVFRSEDGTLAPGSPLDEWGKVFVEAGRKFGRPFDVVGDGLVQDAFKKAGFANITEWEFKCPIGPWSADDKLKEIGLYARLAIEKDIEGWILFVWAQVMGWSKAEIEVYIAHLRRQLRDPKVHSYILMRCVYGRKEV